MSIYKPTSGFAFDIDGIVLDTGTEIWKAVTTHFNIPWSINAWKDYFIEKTVGIPIQDLRPVYEPVIHRYDLPLVRGAAEVLTEFYNLTQEPILFITARRPQFVAAAASSIRLGLKDVPFEIVNTSSSEMRLHQESGHNKIDFLKEHDISFFIDDFPYAWESYIKAGIVMGTLDWPWTRDEAARTMRSFNGKFKLFNNWNEIGDYFKQWNSME